MIPELCFTSMIIIMNVYNLASMAHRVRKWHNVIMLAKGQYGVDSIYCGLLGLWSLAASYGCKPQHS